MRGARLRGCPPAFGLLLLCRYAEHPAHPIGTGIVDREAQNALLRRFTAFADCEAVEAYDRTIHRAVSLARATVSTAAK